MNELHHFRTRDRVRRRAAKRVNARLDALMQERLDRAAGDLGYAKKRLHKLDREWDIDRTILLPFAGMGVAALVLASRGDKRFRFPLAGLVGSMLAYAVLGWSPQAAILRRLGVRTRQEIEAERLALIAHLAR